MISILINERYLLTGKPYLNRLIFNAFGYGSSTWYENPTPRTEKRCRKPKRTDEEVLQEMKTEIKKCKFNAEG